MPCRSRATVVFALLLTSAPALAGLTGNIRGIVRDERQAGLAAATVTLSDARGTVIRTIAADANGVFMLVGIAPGEYTIDAIASRRFADRKVVSVRSGDELFVELSCEIAAVVTRQGSSYTSVVRSEPAVAPLSRSTSTGTTINRAAIDALPLGADRPLDQVIATQPGFVQDGLGAVIPRGRFVASVQYRIDGVPVPDSVGNLLAQSIPLRLVESMDVLSGGMAAEYGNRLGAVVDIASRAARPAADGLVQLRYGSYNTAEPSVSYSRMLGRVGVSVGAGFVYSERALDPPAIDPVLHDTGYRGNLFARFDFKATERDRFELFGFYIYNAYQVPLDPTAIPAQPTLPNLGRMPDAFGNAPPPFIPRDTDATEREQEAFVAFSWLHSFGSRGDLQVSPYYKLSLGALDGDPGHALGATADPGATAASVTRLGQHGGVIAHYTLARGAHVLKAGVELDGLFGRIDFTEWHRDDSSRGIDATKTMSGTDHLSAALYGVYVQERWERGRLTLTGGARLDGYHIALPGGHADDEAGVSPRLGASLLLGRRVAARMAVGMTWQPPPLLDAANAARIHGDASDGIIYDLKPETSVYGELGTDILAARWIRFGMTGWGRWAWNQLDDNVLGNTGLLGYYNYARGRAIGVDASLQVVVGPWLSCFANAEWEIGQGQRIISSKYLFEADELTSTAWETLDESQMWTANIGATLRAGSAFATVLANYGSGLRTGEMNTQHVPGHFRVDVTLEKSFDEIPLRPRLAIDVINLFDAHYAYRLANGLFGSTWAPPREFFVRLAIPLARAR
jgi:outer membrane cobalamin receptor